MRKNMLRKGIIVGILVLFVGASVISGISGNLDVGEKQVHSVFSNKGGRGATLGVPPDEEWNKTFGGPDPWAPDEGRSVEQTPDGGYIIAGHTISYGAGGWDVWLIKTDSNGNEQWSKTYGGIYDDWGYSVHQTNDGGFIVVGTTPSYGPYANYSIWLIKTDSYGNEYWNKTYGGPYEAWGFSGHQTADGGYIIVGARDVTGLWVHDVWLIKTDYCGNEQWNKTFGGTGDQFGLSVNQTNDGGYIIAGYSDDLYATYAWLIKTDPNGNEQWNKTFEGIESQSVEQTNDGGYILTASTYSDITYSLDVWLIKTDSNGTEQWNKTYGGLDHDFGNSVGLTADGGYIITGEIRSYGVGESDVWLIKTDSNGTEQWNKTFGGPYYDVGHWGQQTADGGYIVTGFKGDYEEPQGDQRDLWLIKVASEDDPPVANFTYTRENPTTNDIVQFNDTSIDYDGAIISWWWDFGDNYISLEQNPKHQYFNMGIYNVTLIVTDSGDKTDIITKTIVVLTFDGYIIDLENEWNLISVPYNKSIGKTEIIVTYNGTDYTWQEAVDAGIILDFIYGWDATAQNYIITDTFRPGRGYWIYSYVDNVYITTSP